MQHLKVLYQKGLVKNLKMITQSQYSQIKFIAKLDNLKGFSTSLKAVNIDETAMFQISENGLRIIVENSKFIQGTVYISKGYFSEFHLNHNEMLSFGINLNVLCNCLSIFSDVESSMEMIYKGYGAPLVLSLKHCGEDKVTIECSIKTKNYQEPIDYIVDEESDSFNQVILRGSSLSQIFNEIDKSADELEIYLGPQKDNTNNNEDDCNDNDNGKNDIENLSSLRISTRGVMQAETSIEISETSNIILLYSCKTTTSARYKLSQFRLVFKALLLATKVSLRTNSNGLLELQFMITQDYEDTEAKIYIEFFITPLVDYE